MEPSTGVLVENVVFKFTKSQSPVLDNINITIPRGAIYCLLGPSGCGKTTMIKVLLGLLKPDQGRVSVSCGDAVPGPGLGWMPQSVCLHNYFSVSEILRYYATLGGVPPHLTRQRISTVLEFLNLSDKADSQVTEISGGQQRRLSLGCAIVHSPLLLILDEPTVGTDPLLRVDIWRALRSVADQGTTVLLTTHYIEEAANADIVAFLRLGRILAEGKPQQLLQRFSCKSLERLFFQLCYEDERKYREETPEIEEGQVLLESQIGEDESKTSGGTAEADKRPLKKPEKDVSQLSDSTIAASRSINFYSKTKALLFKNLIVLRRHRLFMCFNIVLPVLNFLIFYAAIGRPPAGLTLSYRVAGLSSPPDCQTPHTPSCSTTLQSTAWLCSLQALTEGQVSLKFCPTESCVSSDILAGRAQLGLSLPDQISFDVSSASWDTASNITVWKDPTNKIKFESTLLALSSAGRQIAEEMFQSCAGAGAGGGALDLLSVSAALGSLEPESHLTMLPGMVPSTLFFMALSLTADLLVTELEGGTLARDWSLGVDTSHNLTAQVAVQLIIVSLQVLSSLLLLGLLYPLPPLITLAVGGLLLLLSLCGMVWGVIISLCCKTRDQTIQAALALIFPLFLLSGVLWPLQSLPAWLQLISRCLPLTPPTSLVSSLVLRSTAPSGLLLRSIMLPVVWIAGLGILTKLFILDTLHRR